MKDRLLNSKPETEVNIERVQDCFAVCVCVCLHIKSVLVITSATRTYAL